MATVDKRGSGFFPDGVKPEHFDDGVDGPDVLLAVRFMASLTTSEKPELPSGFAELLPAADNEEGGRPPVGFTLSELSVMLSTRFT